MEDLHSKLYIHRDIKPENFVIGLGQKAKTVHLLDFGLSKCYIDSVTGQHIPFGIKKQLTGTIRYASINVQKGIEQSRRDDLESLIYLLIYLIRGTLPWQGLKAAEDSDKSRLVYEKKIKIPTETLCSGLPVAFAKVLTYVKGLNFSEHPDYKYMKKLFRLYYQESEFKHINSFQWELNVFLNCFTD